MNIALDTNILAYALAGIAQTEEAATQALEDAAGRGGVLVLSAPVYAELLAIPLSSKVDLDAFIAETKIRVDWDLSRSCWTAAGLAFAAHPRRRKASEDQPSATFSHRRPLTRNRPSLNRRSVVLLHEFSRIERVRALARGLSDGLDFLGKHDGHNVVLTQRR